MHPFSLKRYISQLGCNHTHLFIQYVYYLPIAMTGDKDTNDAGCAHYTSTVQTGYTPAQGFTLTQRPVFVNSHHDYEDIVSILISML